MISECNALTLRNCRKNWRTRPESVKSFQRSVNRKALFLAKGEHRLKSRHQGAERKRKLDTEAEDFILQCVEYRADGAPHGRRHDSVLYGGKRIKYDDLLEFTNQYLESKDQETIKSTSTIRLLSKPKNKRSRQAKFHHGDGRFCT